MSANREALLDPTRVRDDFVVRDGYVSAEFAELEAERLWPRTWQVACREEELKKVGDFITYDILDDSIIVVRAGPDQIRAFHNVCAHRGRRLVANCGNVPQFFCPYHGWKYSLTGENTEIVDQKDWGGALTNRDVNLTSVAVDTWGGFVFINMDVKPKPLAEFLRPVNERLAKYEFEKLRYKWYRTMVLPVNWKTSVEAFAEAYHVQGTHPQFLFNIEDYTKSGAHGVHGTFWYPSPEGSVYGLTQSSRIKRDRHTDFRKYLVGFTREMYEEVDAVISENAYEAAKRVMANLPADASEEETMSKWMQYRFEAAEADGSGLPSLTAEDVAASNVDWHVFPNCVFLHSLDSVLWYRARPSGRDQHSCIFDVWSLGRFPPAKEPPLNREFFNHWKDGPWGRVFVQDFQNLEQVQLGMKSRAFKGARTNPVQERAVSNFHKVLREFMLNGP